MKNLLIILLLSVSVHIYGRHLEAESNIPYQLQLGDADLIAKAAEINSLFDCFNKDSLELIKLIPLFVESGLDVNETIEEETLLHRAISMGKFYEGYPLWPDYAKAINLLILSGADIHKKYNDKTPVELLFETHLLGKWDDDQYAINELHLAQLLEPFLLAGFDIHSTYKETLKPREKISFFQILERYHYKAAVDLIIGDTQPKFKGDPFYEWDLSELYKRIRAGKDFHSYTLATACPLLGLKWNYKAVGLNKIQRKRCQTSAMIFLENGFLPTGVHSSGISRNTPLHQAALLGNKEVIDLLMKNGAMADMETKNAEGFTPLMLAAFASQAESFSCLVHYGADLNVIHKRTRGWTLKRYIWRRQQQFQNFLEDLRRVHRGMETLKLIRT